MLQCRSKTKHIYLSLGNKLKILWNSVLYNCILAVVMGTSSTKNSMALCMAAHNIPIVSSKHVSHIKIHKNITLSYIYYIHSVPDSVPDNST